MDRDLESFKDILEARRAESSNFMWISRKLNTVVAYKQSVKPNPKSHKQEVLRSPKIQDLICKISQKENVSKIKVEQQVKLILDEIGFNKRLSVIRWLGLFLSKVCVKICKGIHVNEEHILKTKQVMGNTPVMFLPSHRSYGDFILMSYVCFTYDIEIPAIAAGMDFHGMWGMGTVLRDTGAFFMRRSYNDDSLYWDTFRQYVHQIVTKGDLPFEFFIEGTRSRTGKSLTPKFGLLSMVLKAFLLGEVPDILLVPVNISYDRVLEERLFAFELLGVPKPKESTSAFFKSLSLINERYGDIYVDFGEPISAKDFFNNHIDRSVHSLKPIYTQELTQKEKDITSLLASNIVHKQQKCCVVTTFNIVALSLMNNFLCGQNEMTVDNLINNVVWINDILVMLEALTDLKMPKENVLESLNIHRELIYINQSGCINLVKNSLITTNADSTKLKGHMLSQETMTRVIPFVMLQLYINPILHYLVDPSLVATILRCLGGTTDDVLFGHFGFLRSLLSYEFVTIESQEYLNFRESLRYLDKLGLIQCIEDKYTLTNNGALVQLLHNTIEPFLFNYYVICRILSQDECGIRNEKNIAKAVQSCLEKVLHTPKTFIHPYCLNLDSLTNCLNRLSSMAVLMKIKINGSIVYETIPEKLQSIIKNLENYLRYVPLDEELNILEGKVPLDSKL